jgi:hypothetical protein
MCNGSQIEVSIKAARTGFSGDSSSLSEKDRKGVSEHLIKYGERTQHYVSICECCRTLDYPILPNRVVNITA